MNVLDKSASQYCTSCQMCGAVCPKNAISIQLDECGFYRPLVNEDLCVDCGLCVKICHKFDNDILETTDDILQKTKLYAATAKSDEVVRNTTSGGVADLLAKQLITDGYKVVGVVYDPARNRAIHKIADNLEQIDEFRGSKYIQSYSLDAFKTLVKECKSQKYAVFGLPCQIYAIDKYLKIINRRDDCILIDLYCHGCPSMNVWTKVSEDIKKRLKCTEFSKVTWRSKHRGWGSFVLEVQDENGKRYISSPAHNEFYDLFFCNQVLNSSCASCKLRGTFAYTDMRLGDFWGTEYNKTFRGMSGVSIISDNGQSLFDKVQSMLDCVEKQPQSFFPYQSWNIEYKTNGNLRKQLLCLLSDSSTDIKTCIKPLKNTQSLGQKLTIVCKQFTSHLPINIEQSIKKIIKQ